MVVETTIRDHITRYSDSYSSSPFLGCRAARRMEELGAEPTVTKVKALKETESKKQG